MTLPWKGGRAALVVESMRERYFAFFICVTATLISVGFSFFSPQIIRYTIDSVIGKEPLEAPAFILNFVESIGGLEMLRSNIWICAIFVLAAALLSNLCGMARRYISIEMGETVAWRMRNTLYAHIQKLTYDWHVSCQTGDIIQRCTTDVDNIRNFLQNQLSELIRIFSVFIVALIMMFSMNVFMSLMALSLIPFILIFSFFYFRRVSKQFAKADAAEGSMQAAAQENYTGVRVVRAFGRESFETEKFSQKTKNFQDIWIHIGKMLGLFWGAGDFMSGFQLAIIIGAGVWRSVQGNLSPGTFLAFYTYCNWMIWPVRSLGRILSDLSRTLVAAGRVKDILAEEPEADPAEALKPEIKGEIVFNNVSFNYGKSKEAAIEEASKKSSEKDEKKKDKKTKKDDKEKAEAKKEAEPKEPGSNEHGSTEPTLPVLRNINFTLKPGESLAILGATGSGKSTLVHLMSRLYDLKEDEGSITIDGIDIRKIERGHLRKHIGLCLQEPFLFSKTIAENISFIKPGIDITEIKSASSVAMVDDTIEGFSEGYNTVIGERGVTLSGGQKQRVSIARMLAGNAPVMIFDDSLSAVDTETDSKIRAALRKRVKNAAVIIISHRISSLMQADKILVLKDGTVEDIGSHRELLERGGSYRRIFDLQRGVVGSANDLAEGKPSAINPYKE